MLIHGFLRRNTKFQENTPSWKSLAFMYFHRQAVDTKFYEAMAHLCLCQQVMELTSMRLLHRTSPPEKLDGPPMFKCGVSYDSTLALARQLEVPLNDLMWDPA